MLVFGGVYSVFVFTFFGVRISSFWNLAVLKGLGPCSFQLASCMATWIGFCFGYVPYFCSGFTPNVHHLAYVYDMYIFSNEVIWCVGFLIYIYTHVCVGSNFHLYFFFLALRFTKRTTGGPEEQLTTEFASRHRTTSSPFRSRWSATAGGSAWIYVTLAYAICHVDVDSPEV